MVILSDDLCLVGLTCRKDNPQKKGHFLIFVHVVFIINLSSCDQNCHFFRLIKPDTTTTLPTKTTFIVFLRVFFYITVLTLCDK